MTTTPATKTTSLICGSGTSRGDNTSRHFSLSDSGLAALRALWDCRVIMANHSHSAYRHLRGLGLAYIEKTPNSFKDNYRLTEIGERVAAHLFDNPSH